jgi:hypothetical protein
MGHVSRKDVCCVFVVWSRAYRVPGGGRVDDPLFVRRQGVAQHSVDGLLEVQEGALLLNEDLLGRTELALRRRPCDSATPNKSVPPPRVFPVSRWGGGKRALVPSVVLPSLDAGSTSKTSSTWGASIDRQAPGSDQESALPPGGGGE